LSLAQAEAVIGNECVYFRNINTMAVLIPLAAILW